MLEGIKDKVKEQIEFNEQRRILKEKNRLEKELEIVNEKKERLKFEQEKLIAERARLSCLNEKELMAEAIMALRGLYSQIENLKKDQDDMDNRICELENDIFDLRNSIELLNRNNKEY